MSYFLTDQKILENSIIKLSGEEVRHILLARRMKKGERFNLQGVDEKRYVVEIKEIGRNELKLEVVEKVKTPAEPEVKTTLFQSYVNEKALDFIFQKSTELGAYKIVLFNSQNTATKLSVDQFASKSVRWNRILWEAAKQSDRIHPPQLEYLKNLEDVKKAAKDFEKVFLCDIGGEKILVKEKLSSAAIIVGPEGGLTAAEIDNIKSLPNCQTITLGSVMLRAETASLASLAIISNINNI
jgi:16S rRNA (uracil1498-N3)-methyltransferase